MLDIRIEAEHEAIKTALEHTLRSRFGHLVDQAAEDASFCRADENDQEVIAVGVLFTCTIEVPDIVALIGGPEDQLRRADSDELRKHLPKLDEEVVADDLAVELCVRKVQQRLVSF